MRIEYCIIGDRRPVVNFINGQDKSTQKHLTAKLLFIEGSGLTSCLYNGLIKKLKGIDIYEVRIRFRKDTYRFLGDYKSDVLYLVSAFKKKSNNTPENEIRKTINRLNRIYY